MSLHILFHQTVVDDQNQRIKDLVSKFVPFEQLEQRFDLPLALLESSKLDLSVRCAKIVVRPGVFKVGLPSLEHLAAPCVHKPRLLFSRLPLASFFKLLLVKTFLSAFIIQRYDANLCTYIWLRMLIELSNYALQLLLRFIQDRVITVLCSLVLLLLILVQRL